MLNRIIALVMPAILCCAVACTKDRGPAAPLSTGTAETGPGGYAYMLDVDGMRFYWTADAESLNIKLTAPTTGWVGVGFNPTEEMKDASFIIGYVKDGVATVSDHHGYAKRLHKSDADLGGRDDFSDARGFEKNGTTEITVRVPLKSGDSLDKPIKASGDTMVLLAYGKTDRLAQQHVFRARAAINFSTGKYSIFLKEKDSDDHSQHHHDHPETGGK